MGILSEIFSGGNTLKRKLNALIKDPAGEINTGVIRAREDNNKLLNLFANAYPMAGDRTVLNSPQQIAQFQREAADTAANMGMAAATVWHGSPHKFDKFDSSKIGTGEGAQAYGHGLYLAENKKVASEYIDPNNAPQWLVNGEALADNYGATAYAAKLLGTNGVPPAQAIENSRNLLHRIGQLTPEKEQLFKDTLKEVSRLQSSGAKIEKGGQLYKVDLPDEHIAKMLDWDKPLSEQAPEVQSVLSKQFGFDDLPSDIYPSQVLKNPQMVNKGYWTTPANQYQPTQMKAEEILQKAGIPGIRYLDGGSRGAGTGSSNFVVFPGNEGLLNIMERNGQPMNQLQKLLK